MSQGIMNTESTKFIIFLICITSLICSSEILATSPEAFKVYNDPLGRYSLKYPSTMKVQESNPNEALIFHPGATFRISIAIEKRIKKGLPNAAGFLEAFKKNLKLEARDLEILKEGKSSDIEGAQAYLSYAYTDKRGIRLIQLCQYYASETSFLQLIISDKQEGFKNLEPIIWEIHKSLRILKPTLQ